MVSFKCRSRLPFEKTVFFSFFPHEKGLGHIFQKYFSYSPTPFFFLRRHYKQDTTRVSVVVFEKRILKMRAQIGIKNHIGHS